MNPDALRTLKVDPDTMENLARRSLLDGPPASVAFDPNDKVSHVAALAGFVCLVVAFGTGALLHVLVACSKSPPPPLPAPRQHVPPASLVLTPLELPPPRSEPPREIQKLSRVKHRPDLSKPLFGGRP